MAAKRPARRRVVPEVWRLITKKNERQGDQRFDVLICQHSVPANDNRYRRVRSCPECRERVQRYADELAARSAAGDGAGIPAARQDAASSR